jgi:tetratricopeptide (TPR) repeat protein
MPQQLRILLQIYYRPHAGFCRVLDEGRFVFALLAAIVASVVFFGLVFNSVVPQFFQAAYPAVQHVESDTPDNGAPDAAQPSPPVPVPGIGSFSPLLGLLRGGLVFGSLIVLSGLYVPAAIVIVARWDSLGGTATVLRREYLPVLSCHLLTYAAILLPLSLLGSLAPVSIKFWLAALAVCALYFLFLSATALRAVLGTSGVHAAVTVCSASVAAALGGTLYGLVGGSSYYLASPFLLYYAYRFFQGDIRIIGSGLSARQSLRRQLEAAKLNPRDSDAHYQIGLILAHRHQLTEAEASFKKAIEIAPDDADSYFQFAKIAREQGRLDEALQALRRAAALDDKHCASEVWRDLGAVALLANHPEDAQPALAKYVERRPYDPEGLYWLGKALKKLGQPAAAKDALERSLEAVATAPSHQRGRLRKWASEAKLELRSI